MRTRQTRFVRLLLPVFQLDAALFKTQESGLPDDKKAMLFEGNVRRMLR